MPLFNMFELACPAHFAPERRRTIYGIGNNFLHRLRLHLSLAGRQAGMDLVGALGYLGI